MSGKTKKSTITIRPGTANNSIIPDIERLAALDGRTVNNYIVRLLKTHVDKNKHKIA